VSHPGAARSGATWCFEGGFGIDLECDGRKICGSAQRRYQGSVLQHGSLFLLDRSDVLGELTGPESIAGQSPPVSLAEQLRRTVEWGEVRDALREGFARALGIELVEDSVIGEEERVAEEILAARYDGPGWSWP
jgi:lipoate-protein ligase A